MYLQKENLQHINSIVHEGKVVLFATDADGTISYTVKQDGFEDSYLNTPAEERTGWENWKTLEFPDEADDKSVIDQEKAEFTYQQDASKFILRSRYKTKDETAIAPVQLVSALGHIYVFRQSNSNTLLVDRFVLDGMTNKLKRKLEVRFKRSKLKHTPTKNTNKGSNGLVNIDSLDFRDANGKFFYEPTTEICAVNNLQQGWFSVVLVPTIENDVNRWHIFAYNSQTKKIESTTIRASVEGLFDVKDYTFFDELNGTLVPRKISGIMKRTLDISGVTVTNGLAATKYDLQEEKETQSREKQLLKTATRLMLAIPTDKGTAAFSFAIAKDGTLAEIGKTPESTIIRSKQKEILLPLNTLDEIKAFGQSTPTPQGIITGLEDAEDLVKISTDTKAKQLKDGDLVKITGNSDYQGFYSTKRVDDNTFEIDLPPPVENLGYWEKEEKEEGSLTFDGMITAYQKTAEGKLRIFCENHGLNNGDEVQISGTDSYNDTYPIQKIDDTHFVIERKWATGEAINVKLLSQKRRGLVFNGVDDYVSLPDINHDFSQGITVEAWVWYDSFQNWSRIIDFGKGADADNIILANFANTGTLEFSVYQGNNKQYISASNILKTKEWMHLAATIDGSGTAKLYKNGEEIQTGKIDLPKTLKRTKNYIGKSNWVSDRYFNGKISDLRTWKVARTSEEIKNNMYLQLTGKEVGLVGYWRLGGISEGKVIDFSVNGNDGTVYGDPYVSAVKLNRKLTGGTDAVKYSNPELFPVSERATYEESFEFKVNPDGERKLAGGKEPQFFTFAYWGKTSQSAEGKKTIPAEYIKQNQFEDLGDGWSRASCSITIPNGISMLRSFEIKDLRDWESLEIRKHRFRLVSDSITEAKYTDSVSLTTLAEEQTNLSQKLQQLESKEQEQTLLVNEKYSLNDKINLLKNTSELQEKINGLKAEVKNLESSCQALEKKWKDEEANPFNYYCRLKNKHLNKVLDPDGNWEHWTIATNLRARVSDPVKDHLLWEFIPDGKYYRINNKHLNKVLDPHGNWGSSIITTDLRARVSDPVADYLLWELLLTDKTTNNKIEEAKQLYLAESAKLEQRKKDLKDKEDLLKGALGDKNALEAKLKTVTTQLTDVQTQINKLNTDFLNSVATPKRLTMPLLAEDGKGLVTQGALLEFVKSASRLNAIETCEGNVQLSYFDTQGRMRQTNYDATLDSKNATFEQWIPDAQRACLNFNQEKSVVQLNQTLTLPDNNWSIEAWFVYPLPKTKEWNTLLKGANTNHHVLVRNGQELGIYLEKFYGSGFNMNLLASGWHHLTAVSLNDTTLFYIDGKKVGDTKAKALADANAKDKEKLKDIKLKVTTGVSFIGNVKDGEQQFGKVAEVRIWEVALTEEEIEVNSKTLLSGKEPGLLAYYRMDEAKNEGVSNYSGNTQYNGTILNFQEDKLSAKWWGCTAPIGHIRTTVTQFDGVDDYVNIGNHEALRFSTKKPSYTLEAWIKPSLSPKKKAIVSKWNNGVNGLYMFLLEENNTITISHNVEPYGVNFPQTISSNTYSHVAATYDGAIVTLYINGQPAGSRNIGINQDRDTAVLIGACHNKGQVSDYFFQGQIAEVRIWNKARTQAEIQGDMYKRLSGKEPNLVAYYPLNEIKPKGSTQEVLDLAGNNHGTVNGAITVPVTVPIVRDALLSSEYSTITLENTRKTAMMRRFFAYCDRNGVTLLSDKRIEALELKWIGNAQFAPTLLGYIEGAPPLPSENLTLSDDYNGATSVELTMSEDVEFSWNRSQESGLGGNGDFSAGLALEATAGLGYEQKVVGTKVGLRGSFEGSEQRQNDTNITASSSLAMTDKLELRGTPEETTKFPHLGNRFIPKNVGYALVVSALADVFVTRLARSGKMVGYQVQPVDGIPPDVNTITFLINPGYTMNGSLDGMTGSSATTDRFFKHVPEMRSQYGSLYPASYYRLQEAYDLKRQIEAEDKRRESYFANFDVSSVVAMERDINKGFTPSGVSVSREEDKLNSNLTEEENLTDEEKKKKGEAKRKQDQEKAGEELEKSSAAVDKKKTEVEGQIKDIEKRSQALSGFASWQRRMEDIQIRAGKRNIVNTYVWDADGGLRTEAQSFANTIQHSIGSSSSLNLGLGLESELEVASVYAGLNSQNTFSLTQTISKTESRSKGIQLNIDLGGLEYKGITDFNDRPISPGEKVDRYRFMSFYLEGSTQNFHDFFSYVVDPEWLQSNSEEARALRQTQAGKPNKAWRVLHRVTYVERPALMGFGRDLRKLGDSDRATAEILDYFSELEIRHQELKAENQQLKGKIAQVQKDFLEGNQQLQIKLDRLLALIAQKQTP